MLVSLFSLILLCGTVGNLAVPAVSANDDIVPVEDVSALLLKLREDVVSVYSVDIFDL